MDPSSSRSKHKYRPVRTSEPVEPRRARTTATSNAMFNLSKPLPMSPPKSGSPDLHPDISLPVPLQPRILNPNYVPSTHASKTSKTHSIRPSMEIGTGEKKSLESRNQRSTDPRRQYMRFNRQPSESDTSPAMGGQHVAPTEENHGKASTRLSHEKTLVDHYGFGSYPIEKDNSPEKLQFRQSMRRRRLRILFVSLIIVILLIVAIILLVIFVRPIITRSTHSIGQGSSTTSLNQEQARCVNDYLRNATSDPSSYSCTSCLPVLQEVSSDFLNTSTNTTEVQGIRTARQFCGIRAIFDQSKGSGQGNLTSLGWMKDDQVCTWGGVSCDDSGLVVGLTLQYPAIPQTIPNQLAALTSLATLSITGDKNDPTGQIGTNLPPSLRDLRLYNTSLQGFTSDAVFQSGGTLAGLTALTMDGNWAMGSRLPGPLLSMPLQTLVARNQIVFIDLEAIGTSLTFMNSLVTLDLSSNGITANLTILYLEHLTTLNLSNNNIVFIPDNFIFPPIIENLDLSNNPQLHGTLTPQLCLNSRLTTCSFVGTTFSAIPNIGCGPCRFL
ncbi:hypothetical protein FS842_009421 [Serendipita sp. 407]|nr:hypothetical protein FS842_009421 [Serendipita sp. 407]